jgi:hypothetical protein
MIVISELALEGEERYKDSRDAAEQSNWLGKWSGWDLSS